MKKIKTVDAVGMTLCHDITEVRDCFKGRAFQRGHVITEDDVAHLLNLGQKHIYIWEENAGEIHEEDAALRLAAMAPVDGAEYSGPSEGKMTLTARQAGLFRVNKPLLDSINQIGEITIATLPDTSSAAFGSFRWSVRKRRSRRRNSWRPGRIAR